MDTGVAIAIITATASLIVALANAWFTNRRDRRAREEARREKLQERQASAKAELDLLREPLLRAALDLSHRIDNIRNGFFLQAYLNSYDEHRASLALTSTLYRFAKYWCIVENLYDRVGLLHFRQEESTRPVADTLRDIGREFASDGHDRGRFMFWREEQRAIAELMRAESGPHACLGFATFHERYDMQFAPWFTSFARDLSEGDAAESRRLKRVQHRLAALASQLDQDNSYMDQWQRLAVPGEANLT